MPESWRGHWSRRAIGGGSRPRRFRLRVAHLSFARQAENTPMPFTDLMMNQTLILAN